MSEFKRVTDDFAVAAQLSPADFAAAKAAGFAAIVNNRPDGEAPEALQAAQARAEAARVGLAYHEAPFAGPPSPQAVDTLEALFADPPGPILAYCRSGTRSITAWAFAQARSGERSVDEILSLASGAGYDLSGHRAILERLAG